MHIKYGGKISMEPVAYQPIREYIKPTVVIAQHPQNKILYDLLTVFTIH